MTADSQSRDLTLDAWRGISVSMVVVAHLLGSRYPDALSGYPRLFDFVDALGTLGVQFFFVISGYIITRQLLQEKERHGRISLAAFYLRRGFRILPAMAIVLAVTYALFRLGAIPYPESMVNAATFTCNIAPVHCGHIVNHLWTLAVEEQFYLAWPALLILFLPRPAIRLSVAAMLVMLALAQLGLLFNGWINNGLCFACIAAGACYASSQALRDFVGRWANLWTIALAAVLLLARPLMPLMFPGQYRLQDVATPALICFLLFSAFRYREALERNVIVVALSRAGVISYGLYLWQQMFLLRHEPAADAFWLHVWPLFIPISIASYFLVERPLMRLGRRLSRKVQDDGQPQAHRMQA